MRYFLNGRKNALVVGCVVLAVLLCGCNRAKTIEKEIADLGVITLETGDALQKIESEMNELTEAEKLEIANYDVFVVAMEEYSMLLSVEALEARIDTIGEVTQHSKDVLDEISAEYEMLGDVAKAKVRNYDVFEKALREYEAVMREGVDDVCKSLCRTPYNQRGLMSTDLFLYFDYMSDEQKSECLGLYKFFDEAPDYVEEKIKRSLKSPSSYKLYDMDVSNILTYDEDEDEYCGWIDIVYSGTNSFGAEIQSSDTVWVYFKVDIESMQIRFTDIKVW